MAAFRAKALFRGRARGSLEMVATGNPSASRVGPSNPADAGRKRKMRESSKTARTTRSPGGTPRRHPPPSPIRLASTSLPADVGPVVVVVAPPPEAPTTPLSLLRGDLQFFIGVRVGLLSVVENLLVAVPEEDLLLGGIEMLCRSLFMT